MSASLLHTLNLPACHPEQSLRLSFRVLIFIELLEVPLFMPLHRFQVAL